MWRRVEEVEVEVEVEVGIQYYMSHLNRLQYQVLVPIPREQQPHRVGGKVPEGIRAILHVHYIIEVYLKLRKCCCHRDPTRKPQQKVIARCPAPTLHKQASTMYLHTH